MRINRETLIKIAEDFINQRTRRERSIVSIYLCGSMLGDDFLLGGTADIDLTLIHIDTPASPREIVRISDEIHLDLAHYAQVEFRHGRTLRQHPWLGPTIFDCKVMYDPQHFMDFTQASVRGQFHRPDYVMGRSRQQFEHARQIWQGFASQPVANPGPQDLSKYLRSIDHAVNAVASLSGHPLTERRFLLDFPARAEAAGRGGLYAGLLGLIGAPHVDVEAMRTWMDAWQNACESLAETALPTRLHPHRLPYYRRAFESILEGPQPLGALWPLLRTWTLAARLLPAGDAAIPAWQSACQYLGLQGSEFAERVDALDAYLDSVDEVIERWGQERGE
jgi:hypothetical protein